MCFSCLFQNNALRAKALSGIVGVLVGISTVLTAILNCKKKCKIVQLLNVCFEHKTTSSPDPGTLMSFSMHVPYSLPISIVTHLLPLHIV